MCGKCGNGLGHEFLKDGPDGQMSRFWIFSHALKFEPKEGKVVLSITSVILYYTPWL